MKRASKLIIMMSFVVCDVRMIGSESLVSYQLIISVDYMSLKELTQVARGISPMIGDIVVMVALVITSLMIYLVNADQLHKHNTMMKVSLVHDEWSTR
jgi:hypothetical protein